MTIMHETSRLVQNGGLCCSVYISDEPPIVIEVYPTNQYTRNTKRLLADTLLRQRLLSAWGYRVVTCNQDEISDVLIDDLEILMQGRLASVGFRNVFGRES
eukprot:TRINITY_DN18614_c0_g1_i7.p2 TRINITY_DN18614_c0_g1~~TRINITY_DN18614_c0_g1_i7.p2  ORF type:complete len:118 (-),score=5.28 TRINITY_DN18614_c0_g1_i7:180-482(-)